MFHPIPQHHVLFPQLIHTAHGLTLQGKRVLPLEPEHVKDYHQLVVLRQLYALFVKFPDDLKELFRRVDHILKFVGHVVFGKLGSEEDGLFG